jgi:transposase InsO family protein
MSRKGNCWDNAVAESFFHSLKTELVHHCDFATRAEAKQEIFEYIEVFLPTVLGVYNFLQCPSEDNITP